jgi:hypothetical protein
MEFSSGIPEIVSIFSTAAMSTHAPVYSPCPDSANAIAVRDHSRHGLEPCGTHLLAVFVLQS